MKTTLRAPTELFAVTVFAEVGVWERRPELQRLLVSGAATGTKVDAAVVAAALPGLSESACRNLLRSVEQMKLIDPGGNVTAFGKTCALSGEAPAWELGVFTFLVAQHPCFGAMPIAFRREKPDGQDRDFTGLEEVPAWVPVDPKRIWASGFNDSERFTISKFPAQTGQNAYCRIEALPPAQLVWGMNLTSGANRLHVEGEIAGAEVSRFKTPPMTVPEAEVASLFGTWEPRWSASAGRMLIAYDGAAEKDGADPFLRSTTYRKVKAGGRGMFEAATVEEVPVGPIGAAEAREWATALAVARLRVADTYVTPSTWTRDWAASIAATPLQPGAGAVPDISTLLQQQTKLPARLRWLLSAGSDLAME